MDLGVRVRVAELVEKRFSSIARWNLPDKRAERGGGGVDHKRVDVGRGTPPPHRRCRMQDPQDSPCARWWGSRREEVSLSMNQRGNVSDTFALEIATGVHVRTAKRRRSMLSTMFRVSTASVTANFVPSVAMMRANLPETISTMWSDRRYDFRGG